MEHTINKMPEFAENFYRGLKNYLETNLYFYGSIQRSDYYPDDSDIDVSIFTENIQSMINKMAVFLKKKKNDFKRFVIKFKNSNSIATGYKVMYIDKENNFKTEFSIYEDKYKNRVLEEHYITNNLPFYAVFLLKIIKIIYYKLKMI